MNIIHITPGAGGMYCGNCFRDNALVAALRRQGHSVQMVPLYLPMTLDEENQSSGTPIFFSGINVYLEQKSAFFRRGPRWLHHVLASPWLLKLIAGRAAKTQAADVGELTLSMLKGEEGNQARELDELIHWLKVHQRPDLVCLSNAMLIGFVRRLKAELHVPVVCMLQGEDYFMDALPEGLQKAGWSIMAERAREADLFIAPSRYFADLMSRRLDLPADRVQVIYNGINLDGYAPASRLPDPPVLGFFARMCREKGLETLVDAFILLKQRNRIPNLRLRVGGGCGPAEEPFVNLLKERLRANHLLQEAEFTPNLNRSGKLHFFQSISVMSTPALYGEGFGLYLIEAWAAGVPVVQPRHAAFPELLEDTGGGTLVEPNHVEALADAIEEMLLNPDLARAKGEAGRKAVVERFNIDHMAKQILKVYDFLTTTPHTTSTSS